MHIQNMPGVTLCAFKICQSLNAQSEELITHRACSKHIQIKMIILNDFGAKHKNFKGSLQIKETVQKYLILGSTCPCQGLLNYNILR
jgi:hypothetical protein